MNDDLQNYVAECERRIAKLDQRLTQLEARVAATITIATRDATQATIEQLRSALDTQDE